MCKINITCHPITQITTVHIGVCVCILLGFIFMYIINFLFLRKLHYIIHVVLKTFFHLAIVGDFSCQ